MVFRSPPKLHHIKWQVGTYRHKEVIVADCHANPLLWYHKRNLTKTKEVNLTY